jgi:ferredoxin-NADP reductase
MHEVVATKLACVAGGTGIAPHISVIREIVRAGAADQTAEVRRLPPCFALAQTRVSKLVALRIPQIGLIFGNKTEEDIFMAEELEEHQATLGDRLHVRAAPNFSPLPWRFPACVRSCCSGNCVR